MKIIARIHSPFPEKFGIPRQSGLALTCADIVFEPEYRNPDALRGIEGFSHLWLIWKFSEAVREDWSPTVRPPKLGGNTRMGVFATRSPFRPNPIGLSSVKLIDVDYSCENAPVIRVSGADLMDGTPIYDIKPYLPYTDSHPEATGGFSLKGGEGLLSVDIPTELLGKIPEELRQGLYGVLENDPRPGYSEDGGRVYTLSYGENEVAFTVADNVLTVRDIYKR
ncbi:MAG: tRNA (N6-threonylcarbamoyladenosine(37)-N6)-methyltransferase TrmO [Oscillospiraceae bacterium]|nr:tRNA (N6-threonylcarbamoyladenosine(37)-N6)-methyltransferase TrmO [Oscillospiraceae bacterium]